MVVHILTITLTFQISFINDQTVQINLSVCFLNVSLGKCIVVVVMLKKFVTWHQFSSEHG